MIEKSFLIEDHNFFYDEYNPVEDINDLSVGDFVEVQDEKEGIITEIDDWTITIDWVPPVVYWLSEDEENLYLNVMSTEVENEEYKLIKENNYRHISKMYKKANCENILATIKRWQEEMKNQYIFEVEEEKVKEWIDNKVKGI